MNRYIIQSIFIQFTVCLLAALYTEIWQDVNNNKVRYYYLELTKGPSEQHNIFVRIFISWAAWFLILMNFVSISLLVTLEMVKFFQANFIESDWMIYCQEKDMKCRA